MDIDKMEAGREMDALIAEIMELSTEHLLPQYESGFFCSRCGAGQSGYDVPCTKYYSTDISVAWQVVEKFIKNNNHLFFDELMKHPPLYSMCSESAALTICRAALKAIE